LFQYRILFKGYQLRGLGQLGIFFFGCFGHKKSGGRHQVVDPCDEKKKHHEYAADEKGTIHGPAHKYHGDHESINSDEEESNGAVRKAAVEQ
jgi:hypothetical protein